VDTGWIVGKPEASRRKAACPVNFRLARIPPRAPGLQWQISEMAISTRTVSEVSQAVAGHHIF
jgi:hypothetical protein